LRRYLLSLPVVVALFASAGATGVEGGDLLIVDSHVDIPITLGTPAADPGVG